MKPRLGIGITYFNERELLTDCLRSVQSFAPNLSEILIYDDHSSSPPQEFIPEELKALVKVIRAEKNEGPARGRNRLLQATQSDWLHFHDADDWFYPTWFQAVCELIEKNPTADVVLTEVDSYKDGKLVHPSLIGFEKTLASPLVFAIGHFILVPCGTFRVSALKKIGGYRESLHQSEDYDFYIRLMASGVQVALTRASQVGIRLRAESRSQDKRQTRIDALKALETLAQELPPSLHDALAERASEFASDLFQWGYRHEAKAAFSLAQRLGTPQFHTKNLMYRWLATAFGGQLAEWVSLGYRRILPKSLRAHFHRLNHT